MRPAPPDPPFSALPPASYGGVVRAEQRLTLSLRGGPSTLQAFVDIAPERLTLVGASALGQRVLSLTYDAAGLREDGSSDAATAEQALRDLQLVAWPLAALQAAVAGSPWRVEEPRPGTRQVWRGDQVWAEIHYSGQSPWDGRSWLVNLEQRYTLDIESRTLR
jgi:hypothetical protein